MNQFAPLPSAENPFSTDCVRPGAVPYVFPAGLAATVLLDRLQEGDWWGQILGPHGSGKSTLLATLAPAIRQSGRKVISIALHDGQRRLPAEFRADCRSAFGTPAVVVIDGYEQLSLWSRWRLKTACRRGRLGLLVTSHAPVGLPELISTSVSAELARTLVERLLADRHAPSIRRLGSEEIATRLARHAGNMREVLMELYDVYEEGRD